MKSAILFLVFNRPDTTQQVLEAIRGARPPRLYVAADGPRPDREGEAERCAEVRRIATGVDWPCEVKVLFQDMNLGCRLGPVRGIDWFFEHEEEGIILEDDILPLSTFFPYCDELLERFRGEGRVGLVSGSNPISNRFVPPDSYFFSRAIRIWGWASWRRAWQHYDVDMQAWPAWRDQGGLRSISDGSRWFESHWRDLFELSYRGGVDWWSYQWVFACWYHGMVCILPADSQIHNLGFGSDAAHTVMSPPAYMRESVPEPLAFPLRHPPDVQRNPAVDASIARIVHGSAFRRRIMRRLMKVKPLVRNIPFMGDFLKRAQVRLQASLSRR